MTALPKQPKNLRALAARQELICRWPAEQPSSENSSSGSLMTTVRELCRHIYKAKTEWLLPILLHLLSTERLLKLPDDKFALPEKHASKLQLVKRMTRSYLKLRYHSGRWFEAASTHRRTDVQATTEKGAMKLSVYSPRQVALPFES